jgi:hypothetical protein
MTEDDVRSSAEAVGRALVAGDVDQAIGYLSDELKRNLGEVVALLPLPAREATLDSVSQTGSGYAVVIRVVGEGEEVRLQTRWKDRNGEPKIVEVSHLSRVELEGPPVEDEDETAAAAAGEETP